MEAEDGGNALLTDSQSEQDPSARWLFWPAAPTTARSIAATLYCGANLYRKPPTLPRPTQSDGDRLLPPSMWCLRERRRWSPRYPSPRKREVAIAWQMLSMSAAAL